MHFQGEQKATNALKEAANVLAESPSALQLRYLQVNEYLKYLQLLLIVSTKHLEYIGAYLFSNVNFSDIE